MKSVVLIGNHLPRRCGIATFTTDLAKAIEENRPDSNCWVMSMNDRKEGYKYQSRVRFEIDQDQHNEYDLAADFLNMNQVDVVCLQHEYGIFGGNSGAYILELLRGIRMPVVTTLHTVLQNPDPGKLEVMKQLVELSDRLVVMSQRGAMFLREIYKVPEEKIVFIPHGIPSVKFTDSSSYKEQFGVGGRKVILSFGLLSPGKGIEYMIDALPEIIKSHPETVLIVLGATHPNLKAVHGEDYRLSLHRRAKEKGVADYVVFHDRFMKLENLMEFIGAADIYVTSYIHETQIVSGTLAQALGMGKAVVSTPYWYAREMLGDGRGKLVPFKDAGAIARQINFLFDNEEESKAMRLKGYMYCRDMVWKEVGAKYLDTFEQAGRTRLREHVPSFRLKTLSARHQRLPEIKLDHLQLMTDDTGILQHARFSVAARDHGYCTDDNTRALIVATMAQNIMRNDASLTKLSATYMSFLNHAFDKSSGRFRNFMSYDRRWLEDVGSEDSHGRAVWGLGVAVACGRNKGQIGVGMNLLHRSIKALENFSWPRAIAFGLIGVEAFLSYYGGDSRVRKVREILANRLLDRFKSNYTESWPWPEDTLTYDNARLAQALILSGRSMDNDEILSMGIESLEWLKKVHTDREDQYFAPVGNNGWYPKSGVKAVFDQQPLEASAMIDASLAAYKCTSNEEWISFAYKCLNWYLGENSLRLSLYDPTTGGCRDGLEAQGVNENQGAESTLAWLTSLLALYGHRGRSTIKAGLELEEVEKADVIE